ncbi:hypothetical protein EC973_005772 [Apophysomyces ossiformis]|uniref:Myb-like domain-containing protein n=1 Tax=Apophysomyces ossiformis TaxID=679940 RepID=A0A8H7BJC9_9FUNG|nr:hypothetical protein EC973_005772 [Apophysomyces ossiformis]
MKIADMLNPSTAPSTCHKALWLSSPPLSPKQEQEDKKNNNNHNHGKPRSRFSDLEDAIICQGVAKGLTWGQISGQLPHRKRATCFNRYRTLQGIRKSRKCGTRSSALQVGPLSPPSPTDSLPPPAFLPTTPPSSWDHHHHHHRVLKDNWVDLTQDHPRQGYFSNEKAAHT